MTQQGTIVMPDKKSVTSSKATLKKPTQAKNTTKMLRSAAIKKENIALFESQSILKAPTLSSESDDDSVDSRTSHHREKYEKNEASSEDDESDKQESLKLKDTNDQGKSSDHVTSDLDEMIEMEDASLASREQRTCFCSKLPISMFYK